MKVLEDHHSNMRKKDGKLILYITNLAILMSFFAGLLLMIGFITLVLLIVPETRSVFDRENASRDLYSTFYTFRFLFMLLFTLASTGVVINILKSYKINYFFIFELDPHYKITPI